jgi:4-hydroxybenzoate polyprenyltransferase
MSRLHNYAQLARLPALPTALADICLGALVAGGLARRWPAFLLLLISSACLYTAGMVWNDFFDVEQDQRERPFRPIPSGRVTRREAAWLGAGLLAGGVLAALLAGCVLALLGEASGPWTPFVLALCLVAAILLYDARLKRVRTGPVGMGVCRFLNVLLGLSSTGTGPGWQELHLASVVGLYIVGVTWFARTEARESNQVALAGAAAVMLAALILAITLADADLRRPDQTPSPLFPYLLVALGFFLGLPISRALAVPSPARVQEAVKRSLMGLILLDTALATALAGTAGLLILLLLVPSLYLARQRWLYAT